MPKKILLADDSITIQKVIELTFSDEDFEVVTVGNGRLALEKLEEVRPDIVLCDIMMPEKDGYEVCQHIKSSQHFARVPVLLLTGAFEPFDQEKATQVGSDGFLAKPFEPETLIAKVKDLLVRAGGAAAAADPGATEVPLARSAAVARAEEPAHSTAAPQPPVATPSLVPEEPFAPFEETPGEPPAVAEEPLAPVSAEESATLLSEPAPPWAAPATDEPDAASTVMFSAGDLPWSNQGQGAPAPPESPSAPPDQTSPPVSDLAEETGAAFEEVLEEDVEFASAVSRRPLDETGSPAEAFTPGEPLTEATPEPEPVPMFEVPPQAPEPPPVLEPEPAPPSAPLETVPPLAPEEPAPPAEEPLVPEPPMAEFPPTFEPADAGTPDLEPEAPVVRHTTDTFPPVSQPAPEPPPAEATPLAAASFADIAAPDEGTGIPPSEAASVPVPVDMVEKIAQRVVAQVSEKVVREIAWEVIPDLAEALIKQEIERLKAELQKL